MRRGFLLLPVLLGSAGCALLPSPSGPIRIWAVSDSADVIPDASQQADQENDVYTASGRLVRLDAAVNEVVSFQVVIGSEHASRIDNVLMNDLSDGRQTIPATRAQIYREQSISVTDYPSWYLRLTPELRRPRRFPDVLVPLTAPRGGLPIEIQSGRVAVLWVDIHVPVGTEPSTYSGALRVTSGRQTHQLNLSVQVWPFALPQTRHLGILTGIRTSLLFRHHLDVAGQPYSPQRLSFDDASYARAAAVLDATMRLIHEHRLSPILRDVYPARRVTSDGRVEVDWSDYDRLVGGLIDGSVFEDRASAPAWPLPVSETEPPPEAYGGLRSPTYRHMLTDYLQRCVTHAAERGWLDRHFAWIPDTSADASARYREFERLGKLVHETDPRIKLLCTLPPRSLASWGLLQDGFLDVSAYLDVWCPPASLLDPQDLAEQQSAGKRTWYLPDRPPFAGSLSMIAPSVHARVTAWLAWWFGVDALIIPDLNRWADVEPTPLDTEAKLIWPGKPYGLEQPVSSIRLKRLARGAQDYEYLWLLQRSNRAAVANLIAGELIAFAGTRACGDNLLDGRPNGWLADPGVWDLARRLMARELARAAEETGAAPADDPARFEQQVEWLRLTQKARQVRVELEGSRATIDEKDAARPVCIEASVMLFNATHTPISGTLSIAALPKDWKVESPASVEDLKPGQSTRRTVRARAPLILSNIDGQFPLDVSLRSGEQAWAGTGRISVLTSQRTARAITLDGRLDDWPIGTVNVAGDFILVGARDVPRIGRATPDRPSLPTTVFVIHDDDALYIAFNCEDDRLSERRITRSNDVRYDELWPAGEDLVEIVFDPPAHAVDPGDLLHVVVKANGAVVTERGVPCMTAVAKHESWPAGVTAAVDDSQSGRWTAELRIPLASLSERAPVMGVNFARFQPRLGEYSSWTGARRYLYSPVSLGSMRLGQ